jgi:hypothetical protein
MLSQERVKIQSELAVAFVVSVIIIIIIIMLTDSSNQNNSLLVGLANK